MALCEGACREDNTYKLTSVTGPSSVVLQVRLVAIFVISIICQLPNSLHRWRARESRRTRQGYVKFIHLLRFEELVSFTGISSYTYWKSERFQTPTFLMVGMPFLCSYVCRFTSDLVRKGGHAYYFLFWKKCFKRAENSTKSSPQTNQSQNRKQRPMSKKGSPVNNLVHDKQGRISIFKSRAFRCGFWKADSSTKWNNRLRGTRVWLKWTIGAHSRCDVWWSIHAQRRARFH